MKQKQTGPPKTSRPSSEAEEVGLAAYAYYLPPKTVSLDHLARAGKLESSASVLRSFGFNRAYIAEPPSSSQLAERAVERLFRRCSTQPSDVDAILYSSALPVQAPSRSADPASLFQYPASSLQHRFGMVRANTIGISQAGCVSFLSALRLAADMIRAEPLVHRVLCISCDVLPARVRREVLYNVISDAACAAIVERGAKRDRILAWSQVTKGFYGDSAQRKNEIVAAYFPTARFVIHEALEKARLKLADIRLIIPHNVNRKSWEILLQILEARPSQFYGRNIRMRGHTIAADHVINLQDAVRAGRIRRGENVLLFTFGFGAHWACMILQH